MTLGQFSFEINTAAYQALRRNTDWRWPKQDRLTKTPIRQFVGSGDDKITLSGRIYPQHGGGLGQLDAMRRVAETALPLMLIDGEGKVYGEYVIENISEMQSNILAGGKPRRIDFTMKISAIGEALRTNSSNASGGTRSIWDLIDNFIEAVT